MYTYVATGLIAAMLAAAGAWRVQEWRHDAIDNERIEQALADQRLQAKATIRREEAVIAAQNESQVRTRRLRLDADAARAAADGLRASTDAALRAAAASLDACTDSASKLKVVFLECSRNYEEVARDADNWENDAVMLRDAWPK